MNIRNYRHGDLDALYRVCLETGASGQDATGMYGDPRVLGHIYAGPYGTLAPESALVIEDEKGVGGYIIGPVDTYKFEKQLEQDWWPQLRRVFSDPSDKARELWSPDERLQYLMHHPSRTPRRISEPFPSHLHIDLLPRFQGRGIGKRLIDAWLARVRDMGSIGAHLGVGVSNKRAVNFYRKYGFSELEHIGHPFDMYYFGIKFS